ncbi:MAG: hypothetical protein O7C66_07370, partial [Alphaproteobacteria bacterium]|nr:hypothetical protein [Alphaproteobacteria bacterium]
DAKAAEAIFRRALELNHTFLAAHQGLRGALGRQEENGGAGIDSSYPVKGACGYFADILHRGTLASVSDDDLRRAIAPAAQAMREKEQSQGPLLVLGKLLLECELTQMAKEILEAALRPEGNHPDLYIALSVCYAKLAAAADAKNITGRLVSEYPMMSRTSPSAEAQVLVLEALYSPYVDTPHYGVKVYSHTNTIGAMPAERVSLHHLCINGLDEDYSALKGDYDVIFNNIGNAELNKIYQYGRRSGGIIDFLDLPTINDPEHIDRTTRDENYRRLKNVENIVFPKTVYFENVEKSTDTMIETVNRDFDFPVLFRTPGHHRSSGLYMADTVDELREAIENMSSDAVYVIQFHESRHSSGNYLMYRTVFIDGVFYPGRMYLSDSWLVSGPAQRGLRRTLIAENSGFQADERGWIDDPEKVLGAANMEALKNLNDVIGLDCFGADVGLLDDGRLLVFEANACMNTLANRRHVEEFPYLKPGADEIQAAIERMILDKAAG